MPVRFEQPGPVSVAGSMGGGAAEQFSRDLPSIVSSQNALMHAYGQSAALAQRWQEQQAHQRMQQQQLEASQMVSPRDRFQADVQSGQQSQRLQAQFGLQQQGVQLQAQLSQTQLTQAENMRLQRMKNAVGDIMARTDLTDEDKQQAVSILQTGITGYEGRQARAAEQHMNLQNQTLQRNHAIMDNLEKEKLQFLNGNFNSRRVTQIDDNGDIQTFILNRQGEVDWHATQAFREQQNASQGITGTGSRSRTSGTGAGTGASAPTGRVDAEHAAIREERTFQRHLDDLRKENVKSVEAGNAPTPEAALHTAAMDRTRREIASIDSLHQERFSQRDVAAEQQAQRDREIARSTRLEFRDHVHDGHMSHAQLEAIIHGRQQVAGTPARVQATPQQQSQTNQSLQGVESNINAARTHGAINDNQWSQYTYALNQMREILRDNPVIAEAPLEVREQYANWRRFLDAMPIGRPPAVAPPTRPLSEAGLAGRELNRGLGALAAPANRWLREFWEARVRGVGQGRYQGEGGSY